MSVYINQYNITFTMNKSNKLILFLNIGCLLIIICIYLFYNIFINTKNTQKFQSSIKEVEEEVKITPHTARLPLIKNKEEVSKKMIYNKQQTIGQLLNSTNDLDYFVMLYGINFISHYQDIYDYLRLSIGWLRYDESPPEVCLIKAMKNYQMVLVSTNVTGPYIINGTTYKTQDLKITYINEDTRKVSNGDSFYYNYTNYFTFKTTKTRLHLIIGSNLKFEKIEYIEDSQRLLIVDKFDRTKQINLIFYPDQIPIQIAKEYISLPNKILLDSNFKSSVSTNMSTIIQFDMIVKNAYKTYSYIYNI